MCSSETETGEQPYLDEGNEMTYRKHEYLPYGLS